jgi:hypothetical protein
MSSISLPIITRMNSWKYLDLKNTQLFAAVQLQRTCDLPPLHAFVALFLRQSLWDQYYTNGYHRNGFLPWKLHCVWLYLVTLLQFVIISNGHVYPSSNTSFKNETRETFHKSINCFLWRRRSISSIVRSTGEKERKKKRGKTFSRCHGQLSFKFEQERTLELISPVTLAWFSTLKQESSSF